MSECGCQNHKKNEYTQAKPKPRNGANKSFQVVQGTRTWFGVGQLLLGEAIGGKKESVNRGIPANSLVNQVVLVLHVVVEDFEMFCLRNLVRALRHFCVHLPIESRQAIGKDLAVLADKLDASSGNGALPIRNAADPVGRHVEFTRQLGGAHAEFLEFFRQVLARMYRGQRHSALLIILANLYV